MDMVITSSRYSIAGNQLVLQFYGRNEDGTRAELTCKAETPYLYIETAEFREKVALISGQPLITGFKHDGINLYNKPLTRIEVQYPFEVPKVRDSFAFTYEADVPYTKRFRYDHGIKFAVSYPTGKTIIEPKDLQPIHKHSIIPVHHIIDIETDDRTGFIKPDQATTPILSFGFLNPQTNTYTCIINLQDRTLTLDKNKVLNHMKELYKRIPEDIRKKLKHPLPSSINIIPVRNEIELYLYYQKYLDDFKPDILMGWNNLFYDMPYIETRAKNEGFALPDHKKYAWFDAMEGYDTLHENALPSKKLEDCAQETLGYGKMPREKVYDMWMKDPERFIAYNLWDCALVEYINRIRTILPYFIKIIELSGCEFEDVQYSSRIVDSYIFFLLQGKVRLPSLYKIQKRTIEGAYVKDPAKGVHEMCGVLDLKSQYPMTILSLNASPETAIYSDQQPVIKNGKYYIYDGTKEILVNRSPLPKLYFQAEPRGLLPISIIRLVEERDDIKKTIKELAKAGHAKDSSEIKAKNEMQRALKYLTNSFYGVITSSYYRLANDDVGETITTISKRIIKDSISLVEQQGHPVIYSDTDSLIVKFGDKNLQQSLDEGNKLMNIINHNFISTMKEFVSNPESLTFQIKFETIYEVFFQTRREEEVHGMTKIVGKKRYVGLIGWDEDHGDMTALPIEKRMKIRGFETRRRNTSKTTYNFLMNIFNLILTTKGRNIDDKLIDTYKQTRRAFLRGDYGRDIFVRAVLSKPVSEYKGKGVPSYVTAFKVANRLFQQELELGDTFYWAYIEPGTITLPDEPFPNTIGLNFDKTNWRIEGTQIIITTTNHEYKVKLNMEKMFQRNIIQPTTTIIEHGLDMRMDKLLSRMDSQNTLSFLQ